MSEEKKEIQVANQVANAEALISQAIAQKVPVETLERLFNLRKSIKAELAKESFDNAMAAFQGECPIIKKTKGVKTKSGITAYKYTPIEAIVKQIKPLLQKHGFSFRLLTETAEKIKTSCIVKHIDGHEEITTVEVPLGNKTDIMSDSQVVAAAMTFSARYCLRNAFGIFTEGDDDEKLLKKGDESKPEPQPENDNSRKLKACMDMLKWDNKMLNIYVEENTKDKIKKWNNLDPTTMQTLFKEIEKLAMQAQKDPDGELPLEMAKKQ